MTTIDDLEEARADLETLVLDVLNSVLTEDAYPVEDPLPGGPIAMSRLAIHDEQTDTFLGVEIRVGAVLARLLASRMLGTGDPLPDDLLDAVGELGNIAGGNVKSLLFQVARLSLPIAELSDASPPVEGESMRVRAAVLGQVAELALIPNVTADGLYWPPAAEAAELEILS